MNYRLNTSSVILKWSIGRQDTVSLSDFEISRYHDMVWLCKLSVVSFQRWFPDAKFIIGFNGENFAEFRDIISGIQPEFVQKVEFVDQRGCLNSGQFSNPYHFWPGGVWWKWIPFRYDITKSEIAVDTDIICISRPDTWYKWLDGDVSILVAPERFEDIRVNTTGDFFDHPVLKGRPPINCGIVGQREGENYEDRFYEITKEVKFGQTHDSLFITEQGAINLWVYSLEMEGVKHLRLDFSKNAWMRDFLYFMEKGINVETVHAVTWHKKIAKSLKDVLEARIKGELDNNSDFMKSILTVAKQGEFGLYSRYLLSRQFGYGGDLANEFLIPDKSF